ncbi:NnrS family protein [Pseudoalteromonas sp. MMG024]|uniref:NnrS family protein n=1 Tax=Pseudoalteromonas sp. MMG024 TaxID=2909980 RepID=UPI001F42C020|nr:NnrS family protein [Pseudoalteromonas sp. MMG024]MCF6459363.1 NnrS family protein [Pseudoalteromonas sp. MMG024]
MLHIQEPLAENSTQPASFAEHPFFQLAFRSSFILGALASIVAMTIWLGFLNAWWQLNPTGLTSTVWHLHEMLFGFGATIATGFVLTAVQTWTGRPSIKGLPLMALVSLWLVIRVLFFVNSTATVILATVLQGLWWISIIAIYSHIVLLAKNRRNYLFIPLFSVMALLEMALLISELTIDTAQALHIGRTMVLMFGVLMGIVGGRVIPFFTRNGAKLAAVSHPKLLDPLLQTTSLLGALVFFSHFYISLPLSPAYLMIAAGCLHLAKLGFWQSNKTAGIALLWSLHLSYGALGVGLILLGASYFTPLIAFSSGLHVITVGAMGLMVLSMMSRVSLGHTGRILMPKPVISYAFLLMALAAIIRALMPSLGYAHLAWQLSAMLWITAFFMFIWVYLPILKAPRQDGFR